MPAKLYAPVAEAAAEGIRILDIRGVKLFPDHPRSALASALSRRLRRESIPRPRRRRRTASLASRYHVSWIPPGSHREPIDITQSLRHARQQSWQCEQLGVAHVSHVSPGGQSPSIEHTVLHTPSKIRQISPGPQSSISTHSGSSDPQPTIASSKKPSNTPRMSLTIQHLLLRMHRSPHPLRPCLADAESAWRASPSGAGP